MGKTYTQEERKARKKHLNVKTRGATRNRMKHRDPGHYQDFDYTGYYLAACKGKRAYVSYNMALKAKKYSEEKFDCKMDIYQCPICGKYHLTSKGWTDSNYLYDRLAKKKEEPRIHNLIIYERFVDAIASGERMFDIRKSDEFYRKGDIVHYQMVINGEPVPSVLDDVDFVITYILTGWGIRSGYVGLGIKRKEQDNEQD